MRAGGAEPPITCRGERSLLSPASQRPLRVSCELEFAGILGNPGSQLDRGRGLVASPTWVPPVGVSFNKRTTHSQLFALRFNVLEIFQEVSHCFVCQTRAASFGIFQKAQDTCSHIPSQRLTFPKGSIPSSRSPGKPNPGVLSTTLALVSQLPSTKVA